jgi:hypothetical protein
MRGLAVTAFGVIHSWKFVHCLGFRLRRCRRLLLDFECMFDNSLPTVEALTSADDATVVTAIAGWARAEAAASARRLAAIAELVRRRADGPTDCAQWSCDNWDAMAAEVAAAQGISHGMASGQMYLAAALRDRLPRVAALFADGTISARLAAAMVWHTDLIKDPETLRLVDTTLAGHAARFGPLSVNKTAQAIDAVVDRYDPAALRRTRAAARSRDVVIDPADQSGTAALWGRLYATDAAVLGRRLTQMAHDVCDDDPRTLAQRRADALGALAAGADRLACGCGNADCPARADANQRATSVVIHVVAEASALDTQPDPHMSGETAPRPITPEMTLAQALAPDPEPDIPAEPKPPAALITSGGVVPAPLLAELIRGGAKVRPVRHPGNDVAPGSGCRPSAALDAFVRCRDLTCRFPNCDRPAEFCDVDHTIPYPLGPTHPSNLKCLCRKHHLLKTFWTAWCDEQRPDGTVNWTSPSGQTYTTRPGSRLLFPTLCLSTGELPTAPKANGPLSDRAVMMPKRRRTREQDRAYRINAERALNAAHVAERNQPPPF